MFSQKRLLTFFVRKNEKLRKTDESLIFIMIFDDGDIILNN